MEVLVPAGVQPLHGRSLLIDGRKDDFIPKAFGGVGVGQGGAPVKVPEGCHLAACLLCQVCPTGPKILQVVHNNFAQAHQHVLTKHMGQRTWVHMGSSQACAHRHVCLEERVLGVHRA